MSSNNGSTDDTDLEPAAAEPAVVISRIDDLQSAGTDSPPAEFPAVQLSVGGVSVPGDDQQAIVGEMVTKGKIDPSVVANWYVGDGGFLENNNTPLIFVCSDRSKDGEFYLWDGKSWGGDVTDNAVSCDIAELLRVNFTQINREVLPHIKNKLRVQRKQLDYQQNAVYLKDVVLELDARQAQWFYRPHQRTDYNTHYLKYNYDPDNRDHPQWSKFIDRALPDPTDQLCLQMFFGYCLVHGLDFQCFFMFPGPPGTGKGTAMNVLGYLLGNEFDAITGKLMTPLMTAKPLDMLSERFGLTGLDRALVNWASEHNYTNSKAEAALKAMTGDSTVTIERKYKDSYAASCTCKLVIDVNEPPRFHETSDAILQRLVIIPFGEQIAAIDANVNLAAEIYQTEIQAVLNWALDGVVLLIQRDGARAAKWPQSDAAIAIKGGIRDDSNQVADWISSCCVCLTDPDDKTWTGIEKAHGDFMKWMDAAGFTSNHPARPIGAFRANVRAELQRRGLKPITDYRPYVKVEGQKRKPKARPRDLLWHITTNWQPARAGSGTGLDVEME